MLPLAVGSQLYICNFLAAPSLPSQLPNSTFPSPLSRAAFWPAHSFCFLARSLVFLVLRIALFSMSPAQAGTAWGRDGGAPRVFLFCPAEAWLGMARQLGQESACQEILPASFYICLPCISPSPDGSSHPSPPSFSLHPCLQLRFC